MMHFPDEGGEAATGSWPGVFGADMFDGICPDGNGVRVWGLIYPPREQ
jgi:hypothetical protein